MDLNYALFEFNKNQGAHPNMGGFCVYTSETMVKDRKNSENRNVCMQGTWKRPPVNSSISDSTDLVDHRSTKHSFIHLHCLYYFQLITFV